MICNLRSAFTSMGGGVSDIFTIRDSRSAFTSMGVRVSDIDNVRSVFTSVRVVGYW